MTNIELNSNNKYYLFKKVSLIDKFNFYEYLSVMLDWWVTISKSLESVINRIKNPYFRDKIRELMVYINSWDTLSKSMKKLPDIFSNSETSIIEAWENSWALVEHLANLSLEFKKLHNLRSTIKSSLTYPFIILLFLILAVFIVMLYVIPAIKPLFENNWVELPFATKALIATSDFISNNFFWLVFFILMILVLLYWYKNTQNWKNTIDSMLLSIPLLWDVYKNYLIASISSTLWSLIWGGIPIMKTLILVWKSTNNLLYENLFNSVAERVSTWKKLVDSMLEIDEHNEYFPSDFIQMLSVWEKTATIDKVSKKINEQYTREVNYSLANLTKWIEPIAIFIAWIFVLWFAFAIFWAILKVTQTIG